MLQCLVGVQEVKVLVGEVGKVVVVTDLEQTRWSSLSLGIPYL